MYRMCGNAQLILACVGAVPAIVIDLPDQQCGIAAAHAVSPAQPVLDGARERGDRSSQLTSSRTGAGRLALQIVRPF
jgi:hypothetical protein